MFVIYIIMIIALIQHNNMKSFFSEMDIQSSLFQVLIHIIRTWNIYGRESFDFISVGLLQVIRIYFRWMRIAYTLLNIYHKCISLFIWAFKMWLKDLVDTNVGRQRSYVHCFISNMVKSCAKTKLPVHHEHEEKLSNSKHIINFDQMRNEVSNVLYDNLTLQ